MTALRVTCCAPHPPTHARWLAVVVSRGDPGERLTVIPLGVTWLARQIARRSAFPSQPHETSEIMDHARQGQVGKHHIRMQHCQARGSRVGEVSMNACLACVPKSTRSLVAGARRRGGPGRGGAWRGGRDTARGGSGSAVHQ